MDMQNFILKGISHLIIQCGKRLIQQKQIRFSGQSARQGHSLVLASRKKTGPAVLQIGQSKDVQQFINVFFVRFRLGK
jgi:hypothetical protein